MKLLNGSEIAGFVKERQAKAVRGLRQAYSVKPKLAIIVTGDNAVINKYIKLKQSYGADILVEVEVFKVGMGEVKKTISQLNANESVHGVIIQLPLEDVSQTDPLVKLVEPKKDVDALGSTTVFDPATPTAILWLLSSYGVDLKDKKVIIIGDGKLVGRPLQKMLNASNISPKVLKLGDNIKQSISDADVIITATGSPGLVSAEIVPKGAILVDAGVAEQGGRLVGDLSEDVYNRQDITVTPKVGGVGPLTICALFENVIIAAKKAAGIKTE